jgi:hypothetical protein
MPEYKTIDVPTGLFIGWGKVGQQVTLRVVTFDATGGTDAQGRTCPQLIGTLTEDCDNYRERGTVHERLKAGEMVTVNAGLANLKKGLLIADPKPGDLVRMTFVDTYKTAQGEGKVIKVEHAKGEPQAVNEDDL